MGVPCFASLARCVPEDVDQAWEALKDAEETLSQQPDHLFGLATAGDASLALGDSAGAREYYRRWLDAYETEMAKNLLEYQEHEGVFPEMRATAEALGRND